MQTVTELAEWSDDRGNRIEVAPGAHCHGPFEVIFRGSNNVLRIGARPNLRRLKAVFDCDNGTFVVGRGGGSLSLNVRVGQDSTIKIGRDTTSTDVVGMSATEGTKIVIGRDVMFASQVQVRADDGHPIFDVRSGKRVNVSRNIRIGDHVWLGWGASILGGTTIGAGSVVGIGSVVKKKLPNNVVIAGVPGRVVRKDVAWERPHLSLTKPFYKPDASTITRTEEYWNLTEEPEVTVVPTVTRSGAVRRFGGRVLRRLGLRR